jgi:DNA-binding transcriptional regulator YdaS (Cro superfamily)
MTEEQETQLRTILRAEGFSPTAIEALVADFAKKPKLLERQLREWKLATETKQQALRPLLARRATSPSRRIDDEHGTGVA